MSDFSAVVIGVYEHTVTGDRPEYLGESYSLADFGTVPAIGDHLVDPGISQGASATSASSYTVKRVVGRYFLPPLSERVGGRIALIVESRPATDEEFDVVYRR